MFKKIKNIGKKGDKEGKEDLNDSENHRKAPVSFAAQEKDPRSEHRCVI